MVRLTIVPYTVHGSNPECRISNVIRIVLVYDTTDLRTECTHKVVCLGEELQVGEEGKHRVMSISCFLGLGGGSGVGVVQDGVLRVLLMSFLNDLRFVRGNVNATFCTGGKSLVRIPLIDDIKVIFERREFRF